MCKWPCLCNKRFLTLTKAHLKQSVKHNTIIDWVVIVVERKLDVLMINDELEDVCDVIVVKNYQKGKMQEVHGANGGAVIAAKPIAKTAKVQ